MDLINKIKYYYQHRDVAAKDWKKNGGKVVGYFCNIVPEELIMAAGFFPLRITGDPWEKPELAEKYIEHFYEPDVRSMFNMLLNRRYEFLDFIIIPHTSDAIAKLYHYLSNIKDYETNLRLPEIYMFDTLHAKHWQSTVYTFHRLNELRTKLEQWAEKRITDDSIREAIETCNENRRLLTEIKLLRSAEKPRITGSEALQIIGSSMFMLKHEHNKLLKEYLAKTNQLSTKSGTRLFVKGSPADNLQLYELIESCNATIVAEDNCWGNLYFEFQVDTSINPLDAILDRYYIKSLCPQMYPMEPKIDYALNSARKSGAEGAIYYLLEWDNSPAWEYPSLERTFKENSIPLLNLGSVGYLIAEDEKVNLKTEVAKFIEHLDKSR